MLLKREMSAVISSIIAMSSCWVKIKLGLNVGVPYLPPMGSGHTYSHLLQLLVAGMETEITLHSTILVLSTTSSPFMLYVLPCNARLLFTFERKKETVRIWNSQIITAQCHKASYLETPKS